MRAVRWDPMNCNYRLDLAELFRALEDKQEWASLSFSVLERASDGKCAARAYANLGQYFLEPETENVSPPWVVPAWPYALRLAMRIRRACSTRFMPPIPMPLMRATTT